MKKMLFALMTSAALLLSSMLLPNQTKAVEENPILVNIASDPNSSAYSEFTIIQEATNTSHGKMSLTKLTDKNYAGTITIPNTVNYNNQIYDVTEIGQSAFYLAIHLQNTGLANNTTVTVINELAYSRCDALKTTELEYNKSVVEVKNYAFYQCDELLSTGLANNNTLKIIGPDAFRSTNIESTGLAYNTTVESIGEFAFMDSKQITSTGLETNTTVTTIGEGIFLDCPNIRQSSLAADSKITYFPPRAFNSKSLQTFIFKGYSLPVIESSSFLDTTLYYLDTAHNKDALQAYTNTVPYALQSLTIAQMPYKTQYIENELFDATGLVLAETFATLDGTFLFQDEINLPHLMQNGATFNKSKLTYQDHFVDVSYLQRVVAIPISVKKQTIPDPPATPPDKPNPPVKPETPSNPPVIDPSNPSDKPDVVIPSIMQPQLPSSEDKSPLVPVNTSDNSKNDIWVQLLLLAMLVGMVVIMKKTKK